jgi:hypothetical protein
MVRHHLMVHPLTIWAPSQKPMNAQEGHPYHSLSISLHCPLFLNSLQIGMSYNLQWMLLLLQFAICYKHCCHNPRLLLQLNYCKCKPYIAIKCCSYNNMTTELCTVARLHCYNQVSRQCIATKVWHVPSQIKICSIDPKINLKKANGNELACQETH